MAKRMEGRKQREKESKEAEGKTERRRRKKKERKGGEGGGRMKMLRKIVKPIPPEDDQKVPIPHFYFPWYDKS